MSKHAYRETHTARRRISAVHDGFLNLDCQIYEVFNVTLNIKGLRVISRFFRRR